MYILYNNIYSIIHKIYVYTIQKKYVLSVILNYIVYNKYYILNIFYIYIFGRNKKLGMCVLFVEFVSPDHGQVTYIVYSVQSVLTSSRFGRESFSIYSRLN